MKVYIRRALAQDYDDPMYGHYDIGVFFRFTAPKSEIPAQLVRLLSDQAQNLIAAALPEAEFVQPHPLNESVYRIGE